jgi:hypothetical protein
LTTTVFKKTKLEAAMASDSRITWVDNEKNLPIRWYDCPNFRKTIIIDGVMYGFAGTNAMFRLFLQNYTTLQKSIDLLDTLILMAKQQRIVIFFIRYDGTDLRLFAYSPLSEGSPEIYKISTDAPLNLKSYAIGSGKYSKQYKKYAIGNHPQLPIRKIIQANKIGMRKNDILELDKRAKQGNIPLSESRRAYQACSSKGGDLFTGGEVKMIKAATQEIINQQVDLLIKMDKEAIAHGAVCTSPINALKEVENLRQAGQCAISPTELEMTPEREALLKSLTKQL